MPVSLPTFLSIIFLVLSLKRKLWWNASRLLVLLAPCDLSPPVQDTWQIRWRTIPFSSDIARIYKPIRCHRLNFAVVINHHQTGTSRPRLQCLSACKLKLDIAVKTLQLYRFHACDFPTCMETYPATSLPEGGRCYTYPTQRSTVPQFP